MGMGRQVASIHANRQFNSNKTYKIAGGFLPPQFVQPPLKNVGEGDIFNYPGNPQPSPAGDYWIACSFQNSWKICLACPTAWLA